jgi:energy-coupling factor transport system permease protein
VDLLRSFAFGQYVPVESPVHRLDPRTKILATLVLAVAVFVARDFAALLVFTGALAGVVLLARIPPAFVLRSLRPVFWLLAFTVVLQIVFGTEGGHVIFHRGPVSITRENLRLGVFYGARLALLIIATTLMTFTTSPVELTDGIERLLRPFRRVGVPAHELALMMTIALRFIPTLIEETDKIMKAQMARGAEFTRGSIAVRARALVPLLVPLFVGAFRRAEALALAMEARCYRGGDERTRMRELVLRPRDYAAFVVLVLVTAAVVLPHGRPAGHPAPRPPAPAAPHTP